MLVVRVPQGYQGGSPRGIREQGNVALKLLGTRKQKENEAGNTGTKAVFREQGTPKSKKMLLGNKGTKGKFCWE